MRPSIFYFSKLVISMSVHHHHGGVPHLHLISKHECAYEIMTKPRYDTSVRRQCIEGSLTITTRWMTKSLEESPDPWPGTWYRFPAKIKAVPNVTTFKSALKTYPNST